MSSRYKLVRRIAQGGMAEVYAARATGPEGFEKDVCVKRVLPHFARDGEFIEMFKAEARLAAKLQHANIVQIFDFGEDGDAYFIAMELVDGRDVRGWLDLARREGVRLPPGLAAFVIHEAARGLGYAHQKRDGGQPLGIVHRDVSPHNLLVSRAGEVKVADFGIAKAASRAAATRSGVLKGKVAYMSPEQARGEKIDARTDVFALGIVLHEILVGARLFQGETETETLGKILHAPIPRPSELVESVPRELCDIAMSALERDRDKRCASMEELARALQRFLFTRPPEEASADGLASWLRRIEPADAPGQTVRTSLASDPGTEPTASAPALLERADAHARTRAAEGRGKAAPRLVEPTAPERPGLRAESDTIAAAATSMTRSSVRARVRRWSPFAVAAGVGSVAAVSLGLGWWLQRGAEPPSSEPRFAATAPARGSSNDDAAKARGVDWKDSSKTKALAAASTSPRASPQATPSSSTSIPGSTPDAGADARAPAEGMLARATPEASPAKLEEDETSAAEAADEEKRAPPPASVAAAPRTTAAEEVRTEAEGIAERAKVPDPSTPAASIAMGGSAAATPSPTPPPAAPAETAAKAEPAEAPPPRAGRLVVTAVPWAEIFIDGRLVSTMPRSGISLPAGSHRVRLRNTERQYDRTFDVEVRPGERTRFDREIR